MLDTPVTGADYYLEVGFTTSAGTLASRQSVEVQARFSKTDWTKYTQTDDYSFNSSADSYDTYDKVTAYVSGNLDFWCGTIISRINVYLRLKGRVIYNRLKLNEEEKICTRN